MRRNTAFLIPNVVLFCSLTKEFFSGRREVLNGLREGPTYNIRTTTINFLICLFLIMIFFEDS